jgi:hypothetical protein
VPLCFRASPCPIHCKSPEIARQQLLILGPGTQTIAKHDGLIGTTIAKVFALRDAKALNMVRKSHQLLKMRRLDKCAPP